MKPPTYRVILRLLRSAPAAFVAALACSIAVFGLPIPLGLVTRAFFDTLSGGATLANSLWAIIALFVAVEVGGQLVYTGLSFSWGSLLQSGMALLRWNLLRVLLAVPGATLPEATGAALSRFRDDVEEVVESIDAWLDLAGRTIAVVAALAIMVRISAPITLAAFVPVTAVVIVVNQARGPLTTYRLRSREALARATGFLGDLLGAVQAVEAAGATGHAVAHLRRLNEARRSASMRDRTFAGVLDGFNANIVSLGTGVILLAAAGALRARTFTVGDFVLFVTYLEVLTWYGDEIARWLLGYRQAGVSMERLYALAPASPPAALTAAWARGAPAALPTFPLASAQRDGLAARITPSALARAAAPAPARQPARRRLASAPANGADERRAAPLLAVRGLTARHPGSGRGVEDVDLQVWRGELVVVTGRIGAGKSTLLQALLGLLPLEAGEIWWEGERVRRPDRCFVPPRVAYTPQVPRLFSEPLRANILLGLPEANGRLDRALHAAVLERDVASLEQGLDTVVGPRGVRLSGGQAQRVAAARMFARDADLYIVDDLSSALDLETERLLWQRLHARPGATVLAVSHRPAALRRADRVVILDAGHVVAERAP